MTSFKNALQLWMWFCKNNKYINAKRYEFERKDCRDTTMIDIRVMVAQLVNEKKIDLKTLTVLKHYGDKGLCPNGNSARHVHEIWATGLSVIAESAMKKGLIQGV